MDALAALALMTKAKLVFEDSTTFLSFPAHTPLSWEPSKLHFVPDVQDFPTFLEFSQLTNALPQNLVFQPALDSLLWDLYLEILRTAELAQGTLSDAQQQMLLQAEEVLRADGSDPLSAPSQQVVAYNQYQQAYLRAVQDYKSQQLTAHASSDPSVQSQWQNVDQPRLRALVDAAETDWETKGFKQEVEQARQTKQSCIAQSPVLQWKEWVSECNPDIDFPTDPASNTPFAPTVFTPYDILGQTDWPSFTMTGAEIPQMVGQAPGELANALGNPTGSSNIESISFEACSVALTRPWFHPEVFNARFWRLPDPSEQLSDGNVPPAGKWPAYICALVLARKIVVSTRATGTGTGQKLNLASFPPIALHVAPLVSPGVSPPPTHQPLVLMHAAPVGLAPLTPSHAATPVAFVAVGHSAVAPAPAAAPAGPAPAISKINPALMLRLTAATFSTAPATGTVLPPSATGGSALPPATPGSQPSTDIENVSILAFICKRLPKCPNPDPNLNWSP